MKAGVKIVFGTDVGGFSWSEPIAQEFPRMVELGMSPKDAIRAATTSAAEMLGMSGQIGVIAPGAYADIVAVAGDPLADIRRLEGDRLRHEGRQGVPQRLAVGPPRRARSREAT